MFANLPQIDVFDMGWSWKLFSRTFLGNLIIIFTEILYNRDFTKEMIIH